MGVTLFRKTGNIVLEMLDVLPPLRKGAKFTNVLILLYAWSTVKLPMFLFETFALGPGFSVTRMLINLPGIVAMAWLTDRLVAGKRKSSISKRSVPVLETRR
jgi:hypothetical protein